MFNFNSKDIKYFFRSFLEGSDSISFFSMRLDNGKMKFSSNRFLKFLGVGNNDKDYSDFNIIWKLIHPVDKNTLLRKYLEVIKFQNNCKYIHKRLFSEVVLRYKTLAGEWSWLEAGCMLIMDKRWKLIFGYLKSGSVIMNKFILPTVLDEPREIYIDLKDSMYKDKIASLTQNEKERSRESDFLGLKKPVVSIHITKRELEIIKYIAEGFTSKEIAGFLNISEHTAIKHRKNIIKKLHVKNTAEMIKQSIKFMTY